MLKFSANGQTLVAPKICLKKCRVFVEKPELFEKGTYVVQASVDEGAFASFFACLLGEKVSDVPMEHWDDMFALARELQCQEMLDELDVLRGPRVGTGLVYAVAERVMEFEERIDDIEMRLEGMHAMVSDVHGELTSGLREKVDVMMQMYENLSRALQREVTERMKLELELEALKRARERGEGGTQSLLVGKPANLDVERTEVNVPFTKPGISLHGIIHYLKTKCEKSGETWPIIKVNAASRYCWNFGESHVIDIGNKDLKSRFVSKDSPKQWLEINFGDRWIIPTHYTIVSVPLGEAGPHMKSWSVSVCSCKTGEYIEIDRQTDNADICGTMKQKTFEVAHPLSDPGNSIRIEMLGKNHAGTDVMTLCKFEIYGKLFEPGKM